MGGARWSSSTIQRMAVQPGEATQPAYPALYDAADEASQSGQRWFLRARRVQLGSLIAAAVAALWPDTGNSIDVAGVVALVAFACVLVAQLLVEMFEPQRAWYEGRAGAESIKHLTWKYAVRADPFLSDDDAGETFIGRIKETLGTLTSLQLAPASGDQITAWMRETRDSDSGHRRQVYLTYRLREQREWYARQAKADRRLARLWRLVLYVVVVIGALGGFAKAFHVVDLDVIGVAATVASAVTAWVEAKQYDTLAVAYGAASHELASNDSLASSIPPSDDAWSKFVNDAEDAISREHRLWTASRSSRFH